MGRLPLNTLTAFRSVAELQNLRAAADALHLTHSAVSQQIRGLEEQLGFELFERRGRRVVLNPAGEALLRSVQSALSQLDDGVQAAAAAASGTAQRIRVTAVPSFAQRELLLGESELWERWFAAAGLRIQVRPVASFNDAGLMLQAAEQNLGLALARELLAADALHEGRLVRLSPLSITHEHAHPYYLVY